MSLTREEALFSAALERPAPRDRLACAGTDKCRLVSNPNTLTLPDPPMRPLRRGSSTAVLRPCPALVCSLTLLASLLILASSAALSPAPGIALSPATPWPGHSRGAAEDVTMTETHALVATGTGI